MQDKRTRRLGAARQARFRERRRENGQPDARQVASAVMNQLAATILAAAGVRAEHTPTQRERRLTAYMRAVAKHEVEPVTVDAVEVLARAGEDLVLQNATMKGAGQAIRTRVCGAMP